MRDPVLQSPEGRPFLRGLFLRLLNLLFHFPDLLSQFFHPAVSAAFAVRGFLQLGTDLFHAGSELLQLFLRLGPVIAVFLQLLPDFCDSLAKIVQHARAAVRLCSALPVCVSLCQKRRRSRSLGDSALQLIPYSGNAFFRLCAAGIDLHNDVLQPVLQLTRLRLALCPPLIDPFRHIQDKSLRGRCLSGFTLRSGCHGLRVI